jgi:hypothetical protein
LSLNAHRLIALAEIFDADRRPDTELILANVPSPRNAAGATHAATV